MMPRAEGQGSLRGVNYLMSFSAKSSSAQDVLLFQYPDHRPPPQIMGAFGPRDDAPRRDQEQGQGRFQGSQRRRQTRRPTTGLRYRDHGPGHRQPRGHLPRAGEDNLETIPKNFEDDEAPALDSCQMLLLPRKHTLRCTEYCACHDFGNGISKVLRLPEFRKPRAARATTSQPFRQLPNAAPATQTHNQMHRMLRLPRLRQWHLQSAAAATFSQAPSRARDNIPAL